jgi:hypothetical protein
LISLEKAMSRAEQRRRPSPSWQGTCARLGRPLRGSHRLEDQAGDEAVPARVDGRTMPPSPTSARVPSSPRSRALRRRGSGRRQSKSTMVVTLSTGPSLEPALDDDTSHRGDAVLRRRRADKCLGEATAAPERHAPAPGSSSLGVFSQLRPRPRRRGHATQGLEQRGSQRWRPGIDAP